MHTLDNLWLAYLPSQANKARCDGLFVGGCWLGHLESSTVLSVIPVSVWIVHFSCLQPLRKFFPQSNNTVYFTL